MTLQNLNFPTQEADLLEKTLDRSSSQQDTVKDNANGSKGNGSSSSSNPINNPPNISYKEEYSTGMEFKRVHTQDGISPYDMIEYDYRTSVIQEPDGTVVFEMNNVEVPKQFSQLATDILVSKYFRKAGVPETGHETSIKQAVHRIVHTLRREGEARGYFADSNSAQIFQDELAFLLLTQRAAFNSPVWFNAGLWHEYGIKGSGGNWFADPKSETLHETEDAYSHPQLSACFIQSVDDDLMGLFNLAKNEAKLFKFGSGTGTNFSNIRSRHEKLSGGGTSSGLMSFLEVLDRGAGATKSGGTTRRAAKMVILEMDHPEIKDFIDWKVHEEEKANALMKAGYEKGFEGEAYRSVSGQNSNNSVRITDEFMDKVINKEKWQTINRTTGEVHETWDAQELFQQVSEAAWKIADPGVQFDSTVNKWHTCKESGRINGSNPCSEFMFLDDSACNLASINLMKYLQPDNNFLTDEFRHAIRLFILAQEIIVDFASYPTDKIALNSVKFRPLGLGYANLGTLLMTQGIPYNSEQAFATSSAITALMTGEAYRVSAEIASHKGAFVEYDTNRESMLHVMQLHHQHLNQVDKKLAPGHILQAAQESWHHAYEEGQSHGYRNAQVTLLAPTGTIGLLMDCDTTGVEPDFSLIKYKKLAGGGYFKIINNSLPRALTNLGYSETQIQDIKDYILGKGSLGGAPYYETKASGGLSLQQAFSEQELIEADKAISQYQNMDSFTPFVNPKSLFTKGFSVSEIKEIQLFVNGSQTIEGAPHLKQEHYPVFDCANKVGIGQRFIAPIGHVKMMASVQPFLSGAISKTVNLPNHATVEEVYNIYMEAWKRGVKSIALYRDGSKLSQPLSSSNEEDSDTNDATQAKATPQNSHTDQKDKSLGSFKDIPLLDPNNMEENPEAGYGVRGVRHSLPIKRSGFTLEASVSGHKLFLRTGEYEDGSLGEIFVDMYKEGASYRSLLNTFAIAVSVGLQYGVPLEKFVNAFTFTRFEPNGKTDHPFIRSATSILDFIFRVLGYEYLNRTDFLQVKPETMDELNQPKNKYPDGRRPFPDNDKQSPETDSARPSSPNNPSKKEEQNQEKLLNQLQESAIDSSTSEPGVHEAHDTLDQQLAEFMGDAPQCNVCGHLTVRNGTCYKCLNCGNSLGCS